MPTIRQRASRHAIVTGLFALAFLAGCTPAPVVPTPSAEPWSPPDHPIQVDGNRFVDTRSGGEFPVRGTNFFSIVRAGDGLEDRFFSPTVFDVDTVREEFERIASFGYTTVRIFLDTCSEGPACITTAGTAGLNPE